MDEPVDVEVMAQHMAATYSVMLSVMAGSTIRVSGMGSVGFPTKLSTPAHRLITACSACRGENR